jgi:hypothetical protein
MSTPKAIQWFIENRRDLTANVACMRTEGMSERRLDYDGSGVGLVSTPFQQSGE